MKDKKFHPFKLIRKHKRAVAFTLSVLFFTGMIRPTQLLGLTGGPSTPEANSPSKITSSKMVDPFTGNLDYSISVMEVGDYPLSLSYNADVSMDQEASWVGLGWTLNPGSISRSVRGLPDDFKGSDKVKEDFNTKPNIKAGLNTGINLEAFGVDAADALGGTASIGANLGIYYDNYQGIGLNYSLAPSISVASGNKGILNASLGINSGSHKNGVSLSPSLSLPQSLMRIGNVTLSSSFNSMSGIKSVNLNVGMKNDLGTYGINFNSFADRSYKPKIKFPMTSTHGTFKFSVGGEIFGIYGSGSLKGYYSQQHLKTRHKDVPAYGYMYTDAANNNPGALLDFKREKEGPFTSQKPNLPIPNYTHDVFNISGSGLSGSFRAHRGDVGLVYDHRVKSLGGDKAVPAVGGFNLTGEVGAGNLIKVGVGLKTNNSENTSGIWESSNDMVDRISALSSGEVSEKKYEPFYFKMSGEKHARNNKRYYSKLLGRNPAKVRLANQPQAKAYRTLHDGVDDSEELKQEVYKKNRARRSRSISYLTAQKAKRVALNRNIKDYPVNSTPLDPSGADSISRLSDKRKHHHLSQITVGKKGKRYIYGIPAYNNMKKEVAFNVSKNAADCQNGFVSYNAGKDNSIDNQSGLKHYYSATTTPAYAYSYLLSAVVSEDYVDVSDNGPTPDDMGNYTRFNYSRVHKDYKWRTPYRKDKANYQENQYSLDNDNMANYVYGTKEIWYLNSMETRNHVAKFIIEDRQDGLGVKGENGGKNTNQKLKKLSKIELYTRSELKKNGSNATPLKTVHFEYDYSLCPGVPNRQNTSKGKLTLRKVYYTYGDSEKGHFSPYKFTYHSGKNNPSYKLKSSDRFGFYKENTCKSKQMSNMQYPYVDQDTSKTNEYIKAWKLKKIQVPSGGTINIDYEPDDYAYVQDKKAMQMFKLAGFAHKPDLGKSAVRGNNKLYQRNSYKVNDYIFFDLKHPVSSKKELKAYLPENNHLFFKIKADVIGSGGTKADKPTDSHEYISGFAQYEDFGMYQKSKSGTTYSTAWIKLEKVEVGDYELPSKYKAEMAHPFAKRTWIYSKNYIPKRAFDRADASDKLGSQMKEALESITKLVTFFKSLNSKLIKRNFAQKVKLDKSFIRLNSPGGKKLGGGHRVSRIVMSDAWDKMTASGQASTYGKVYDYTKVRNGEKISSGVIAYEPRIGQEENPFYQPVFYKHNGDEKFMTKPFGRSFFPGPTVGYSRVEVRDLPHPSANPAPAGYKVHKFYTAKDFPVITERTNLQDEHDKQSPFASLNPVKLKYNEKRAVSQGYKVVLNDMHGKPKARYTYRHGSNLPFNGVEYKYKLNDRGQLDNTIRVMKPDKTIAEKTMGVDVDFVVDARQQKSVTEMKGVNLNMDGFLAGPWPLMIPVPLPSYKKETTIFRSIVAAKVVRKRGIIKEVTAYKNGAKLKTKNKVFDAVTGQPVVTKEQNKFGEYSYKTKIPAHRVYSGMGPAYPNIMATIDKVQVTNGTISNGVVNKLLTKGDKLYMVKSSDKTSYTTAWVLENSNNRSVVIDKAGSLLKDDKYNLTVIRSGYDNKGATTIGTVTSMNNPVKGNRLDLSRNLKVLSAGAKEYKEDWQTYAGFRVKHTPTECNCTQNFEDPGDDQDPVGISHKIQDMTQFEYILAMIQYSKDGDVLKKKSFVEKLEEKTGDTASFVTIQKDYVKNRLFVSFKLNGKGREHCKLIFRNLSGLDFPRNGKFINVRYDKQDPYRCDDIHNFKVDYVYLYKDTTYQVPEEKEGIQITKKKDTLNLSGYSDCFPVAECEETELKTQVTCQLTPGEVVNPFVLGIRGTWRPFKQYDYHARRVSGRIDRTGYYKNFSPFSWSGNPSSEWVWKNETTKTDPFGRQLEQKDPLGNFTANIYGFNYSQVKASVKNAPHNQAGFDGFEDYKYYNLVEKFGKCSPGKHTHFKVPKGVSLNTPGPFSFIDDTYSHTGKYSAQVMSIAPLEMKRKTSLYSSTSSQSQTTEYILQPEDYVGMFSPQQGTYFVSAWVYDQAGHSYNTVSYQNPRIEILADGNAVATLKPEGNIIDGWQQINGQFDIPLGTKEVTVRLATENGFAYFDDFRIHPYDAQMQAYVYNPFNLRHVATLDHNNYASFFQYNEEGEFTGTKKETSRGIISVKESRKGSYKADK